MNGLVTIGLDYNWSDFKDTNWGLGYHGLWVGLEI